MKKILFVVGSLRAKSFNRQLAQEVQKIIGERAEVSYLEYEDLPLMNQDIEQLEPESVARVRREITEADCLWVFTPEYNFSYPGHVKNLFDWMSRPVKPMDYASPTCIAGKRVAISGAGGKNATANCRARLTELLQFIKAEPLTEPQTGIILSADAWTTDVLTLSEEQRKQLSEQVDAFLKYTE